MSCGRGVVARAHAEAQVYDCGSGQTRFPADSRRKHDFELVLIVSWTVLGAAQASTSQPMSPFAAGEVSLERWEGNDVFGTACGAFGGNDIPE